MKVKEILESDDFQLMTNSAGLEKEVKGIISSDLLSHVMAHADKDNIFITVLNNTNVLGVASLLDCSCVVFPHNIKINESLISKANELEIALISTPLSTAQTVINLYKLGTQD